MTQIRDILTVVRLAAMRTIQEFFFFFPLLFKAKEPKWQYIKIVTNNNLSKLAELLNLTSLCKRAMIDGSREAFCNVWAEARQILELSDLELAKIFQISLPTVGRWARGEAAPHPVGRNPILGAIMKRSNEMFLTWKIER